MIDFEQWEGFEGRIWKEEVNVRDFIQKNYTPYNGDESFLADPTEATNKLWGALQKLQKAERAKGGVLDMETEVVSGLTAYGPGYIDESLKEFEQIVGLQTDKPLKRAFMPYGGIKMAEQACTTYGYQPSEELHKIFTDYTRTHNQAVFDAYTPEMKAMGLSEVSSNKKEGDSEFILRQLAERVPLSFWCEVYGCGKEEAARKFAKHPPFRKFLELEDPILNFSDGLWAFHTLKEDPSYLRKPELVAMLTPSQREEISWPETVRDFGFIPDSWYGNDYEAWGPKFSSSVMSWILKKDYLYYAADMAERLAMHIPSHLRNLIKAKAASSAEASPSMNEFCSKMLEFMDLKSEIDTLLNEK